MKHTHCLAILVLLSLSMGGTALAQQGFTIAGGDCSNSQASISYSAGQTAVCWSAEEAISVVNITRSLQEGLQQPPLKGDPMATAEPLNIQLSVYPNPTAGQVVVEYAIDNGPLSYTLCDASGKALLQGSLTNDHQVIDLTPYAVGTYLLVVSGQQSPDNIKKNIYKIIKSK